MLFFGLLLLPTTALSAPPLTRADCPTTNFSAQLGPASIQGDSNLCHAFVASDLITVNQGLTDHVSTLDVASNLTVVEPEEVFKLLPPPKSLSELGARQRSQEML